MRKYCGVDCTAVVNAIKQVEARAASDKTLRRAMEYIHRECEAGKSNCEDATLCEQ